ncbi:MAG: MoaD/ThiS family protein [Candidatus Binatia bacterium]
MDLLDSETGGVRSFYRILLGGRDYRCLENRLETSLTDGDQIAIFPPVAGG